MSETGCDPTDCDGCIQYDECHTDQEGETMNKRFHQERIRVDMLGDMDGYTNDECEQIVKEQTNAIERAVADAGCELVWDDMKIWSTDHAYGEDGPLGRDADDELMDVVCQAIDAINAAWL